MGPFSLDDPKDYSMDVRISDGGQPIQTSITKLAIKVCSVAARSKTTKFWGCDHTHQTILKVQTKNKEFIIFTRSCVGVMLGGFPRSVEPALGGWEWASMPSSPFCSASWPYLVRFCFLFFFSVFRWSLLQGWDCLPSFWKSEKQALNTDGLSSLNLGRVHPVTWCLFWSFWVQKRKIYSSKTFSEFVPANVYWGR